MNSTDQIKKEISNIREKMLSNKISDEEREICRDKIKELSQELQSSSTSIEKKVVPVETNSVIADVYNAPRASRFIRSDAFVL